VAASTPTPSPSPAAGAGSGSSGVDGGDASGVWTPTQHAALQAALKKYPASMDKNERWKAIAEAVPGKSKKDCILRFKEIREKVLAAKGGAAAGGGGDDE